MTIRVRRLPHAVRGGIALACFLLGGAVGQLIAVAFDAPTALAVVLWIAGFGGGYLLGRSLLRALYLKNID
jgi:hypothetical protein